MNLISDSVGSSIGGEAGIRDSGGSDGNEGEGLQTLAGRTEERRVEASEVGGSSPSQRATFKFGKTKDGHASNPIRRFQLRWREPLGRPECPHAYRWTLNLWLFAIRVHQWIRSDDKRYMHDHPWHFVTLVVRGGYTDVSYRINGGTEFDKLPETEIVRDVLRVGSIRLRPASHRHYVEVGPEGAWTVLLTSPVVRHWGYWVKSKFTRPLRFFGKFGHPPCHES